MKAEAESDPDPSEQTPFERFEDALRRVLSVPKRDLDKAQLRRKKEKDARKADKQE